MPCVFAAAHLTPTTSVISHILSITAPLSHTCTTYRPVVLIKKTTDISSGKMNKRLMSHFRPRGWKSANERVISSLSNHLCNVTSPVCAHLCQQQRFFFFQNVSHWLFLPTTLSPTLPHPPPRHPLSLFFHYPFYAVAPYVTDCTVWAPLVLLTLNKTYQLN